MTTSWVQRAALAAACGLLLGGGVDPAAIDPSVRPGDDFFGYANGAWLKSATIPEDRASYGVGAALSELTDKRTADLIAAVAASGGAGDPDGRRIADTYTAFMDEAGIEARGLAPIRPDLARIAAIASRADLAAELGSELRADVDILNNTSLHTDRPLGVWVAQDLDDPARYAVFLVQGGLGMPDRDYYLDPSPRMEAIRAAYRGHIEKVLALAGIGDAPAKAAAIYDLERRLAAAQVDRATTEDVKAGDNHWSRADFDTKAPGLDWSRFLGAAGLGARNDFVVWQPASVRGLSALAASEPLGVWRDYLAFHALDRASNVLPAAFVGERFAFYGKALSGTPVLSARWKRAVAVVDNALGDAVGRLYVAKYFPPSAKAEVQDMAAHLLAVYARRIDALAWMDPETKVQAKAKLAAMRIGVGYPDQWRGYAGLETRPDDAYGNWARASLFDYRRNLAKLGRPVDRSEWVMTPQLVNAVNLPAMNALNFPAAYLQPPNFDPAAPAAANYGGVGATIGHEISHSFDDEGALFDARGRLANWWTPADFAHFTASGEALTRQFDQYRPFPDLAVRGRQTLSENIADLAGLAAAHDAYLASLKGAPAPLVDGFTGEQQFFLAYAQGWRTKMREAALRQQIVTDGHAPAEYRADTVRNLDAWYAAFQVKPGDRLYLAPADRVRMW
ncbi:MAG: M13 family metallopeptidase [Caulobacteraceae bacterium]|nr:M13 family metallopeptidase [Caulobacteraceae bacterium]